MSRDSGTGWRALDVPERGSGAELPNAELARAFARCFGSPEGETALRHLADMTLRRALDPDAADAQLRHLEGQRQLVAYVHALVARGRTGQ